MSAPHVECGRVGKYDCVYDEFVFALFGDEGGVGEGDVQAPCAWFTEFTLGTGVSEEAAVTHYGSHYLVLRELNDGHCFVEVYDTVNAQQERIELLQAAYEEWDLSVLADHE